MTLPHPSTRARGFTLLELLIAVAAFAIVLVAINAVFYSAIRLRNKSAAAFEESLTSQQALTILKRDLTAIVPPGGTMSGELKTLSAGNTQASPEFYTASGLVSAAWPWGEVQKVSYLLLPPTNRTTGFDLIRLVTRNLLPSIQEDPVSQWLMGGVESFAFFFHNGTDWRESWDSTTDDPKLPRAIKVRIQPATEGQRRSLRPPIEIVVPIMVQGRTNENQQAGT